MVYTLLTGDVIDVLRTLPEESVHCVVTSPPYWGLRSYLPDKHGDKHMELGLESTPDLYVQNMVDVFREVRRVLRPDGCVFLNLGDSYNNRSVARRSSHQTGLGFSSEDLSRSWREQAAEGRTRMSLSSNGLKEKDLLGIPWMVAFALRGDGWWLRQDIIWAKGCSGVYQGGIVMPDAAKDRFTKSHEYVFFLTKNARYYWDYFGAREDTIYSGDKYKHHASGQAEEGDGKHERNGRDERQNAPPGRNRRSVWTISPKGFSGAHFATFPVDLVVPCVQAATSDAGVCPTCGSQYRRVVERTEHVRKREVAHMPGNILSKTNSKGWAPTTVATENWEPGCKCDAKKPVPALVLDPFSGAATTGLVCKMLGRNYIGIDLNPEYNEIARNRIDSWEPRRERKRRADKPVKHEYAQLEIDASDLEETTT